MRLIKLAAAIQFTINSDVSRWWRHLWWGRQAFNQGSNLVIQKEGGRARPKATGEAESLAVKGVRKMGDKAERIKPPVENADMPKAKKQSKKPARVMDPTKKTKIVNIFHSGSRRKSRCPDG